MHELITIWRAATVGEVCWAGRDDRPQAMPVTPLLIDDVCCVALPYAHHAAARELAAAPEVVFAVTDTRSAPRGGGMAAGCATLQEDLGGTLFKDALLGQELVKYPPSRTLADTPLLRKENWWWLPRLIVRLEQVSRTTELPVRTNPEADALLVRDGTGLRVDTVRCPPWTDERMVLTALAASELRGDGAPALLMGHDYSVPDLERWEPWQVRGRLLGDALEARERAGEPDKELPPLRLVDRVRRQHRLARDCQRGIKAAERGNS